MLETFSSDHVRKIFFSQFGQQIQGLDLQALIAQQGAQQQAQTVNTSATPVSAAAIPVTQASATTNFQQTAAQQQTVPQAQNLSQISQRYEKTPLQGPNHFQAFRST